MVQFNESVKGSAEFTGDIDRLEQFVEALQAWGGTSLYDAIHYGLNRVRDQPGRKAVMVFSDGADTTSSMQEQEVVDYARAVEATVYSVRHPGRVRAARPQPAGLPAQDRAGDGRRVLLPGQGGRPDQGLRRRSPTSCTTTTCWPTRPSGARRDLARRSRCGSKRKDAEVRVRKGYFAVRKPPQASP